MANLTERFALKSTLRDRVTVALAAALTDVLIERLDDQADDDAKKRLRIKQRWAINAMAQIDKSAERIALMVAAKAPDAQIDSGGELDDTELTNLVGLAVDAIAGVELQVPVEQLPGASV